MPTSDIWVAVATPLCLLLKNLQTSQLIVADIADPEYYGISWFPDGQELILSHSGMDTSQIQDTESYARSEVGWVSHGQWRGGSLSAPHQLLCAPDGAILCTNTGRNAVTVIDPSRPGWHREIQLSAARWDRLAGMPSGDHLNSLYISNGILYVLGHGFRHGSKLARFTYPGLELLDLTDIPGKTGMHNIWVRDDGGLISCDSNGGGLVDLSSKRLLWEAGASPRHYTRGLAATPEIVLVGASESTARVDRAFSLTGLWVLDARTWRPIDHLQLGPFGQVNDVRILSVPDLAHHGHPFAGLASLLGRDALRDRAQALLARSRRTDEVRRRLPGLHSVLALPTPGDHPAWVQAGPDDLCLLTHSDSVGPASRIAFDYELPRFAAGHASAVWYAGQGDDTDMTALLLQAGAEHCELSLWVNDGCAWQSKGPLARELPRRGRLELTVEGDELVPVVAGQAVAAVPKLPHADGRLGVRFLGAAVGGVELR